MAKVKFQQLDMAMSKLTPEQRAHALSHLSSSRYRWSIMMETTKEIRDAGGFGVVKDSEYEAVWPDIVTYVQTDYASDALLEFIVRKRATRLHTPQIVKEAPKSSPKKKKFSSAAFWGASACLLVVTYYFTGHI